MYSIRNHVIHFRHAVQMADALDALVPIAIKAAVAGFASSAWHVRNSSLMLYAAGEM